MIATGLHLEDLLGHVHAVSSSATNACYQDCYYHYCPAVAATGIWDEAGIGTGAGTGIRAGTGAGNKARGLSWGWN